MSFGGFPSGPLDAAASTPGHRAASLGSIVWSLSRGSIRPWRAQVTTVEALPFDSGFEFGFAVASGGAPPSCTAFRLSGSDAVIIYAGGAGQRWELGAPDETERERWLRGSHR